MKNPFKAGSLYPFIFIVLTMGGLLSFAAVPHMTPASLSTGFRDRDRLISWYNHLRLYLGDRDFGNIVIGKKGWIFYMDFAMTTDYQRTDLFPKADLNFLRSNLDRLSEDLRSRGITLLLVIPPDKGTIYPQYMPDQIPVLGPISRLDQFLDFMQETGRTRIIDLRPVLSEASREDQVYFRTDSHWNDLGAYLGYVEIMRSLAKTDPRLTPHPPTDFRIEDTGMRTRDLPRILQLDELKEQTELLTPKFAAPSWKAGRRLPDKLGVRRVAITDSSLPALLVLNDSFYGSLAHFIELHFSRTTVVAYTFNPDIEWLAKESPDVVIIEMVERNLSLLQPLLSGFYR